MNSKANLKLFYVAIALLAAAAIYQWLQQRQISQAASPRIVLFGGGTSSTLSQISIVSPGTSDTQLTQRGGQWFVDAEKGFRADVNLLSQVLSTLETPIEGDVVSTNPDSFSEYHLTPTSGTQVKISGQDGKVLANLIIGKEGGSAFTSYVRSADGKEAISAQGSLTFLFKKPDGWRDRGILEIPAGGIIRVENEGSSSSLTVSRTSPNTWQVDGTPPREAITARINSLISGLSTLRAQDFASLAPGQSLKDLGLDPPRQKVTVVQGDFATSAAKSVKTVLLFGRENEEGAIFAKRSDSEALFVVPEGVVRQLVPTLNEIAILPPETIEERLNSATPAVTPTTDSATTTGI